jgi:chemotaxis protein MotA
MDKSTPLGLLIGFGMIVGVLFVSEANVSPMKFVDPPALMMVFGGTVAVALVGFPLGQVMRLFPTIRRALFFRPENPQRIIDQIVELAETARREGLLALETRTADCRIPLLRLGLQLVVDGTSQETLQQILRTEIDAAAHRHRRNARAFELIGRCGPAFGMIATLLGLIMMLGHLDSPKTIGPSMAVALIGTLYGVTLANLVCIPMAEKLAFLSQEEQGLKEIIVQGVLAIHAGDNPRIVRYKLDTFLPAPLRRNFAEDTVAV